VNLTTHHHLTAILSMGGAIYHLPHMPSWLAQGLHLYSCPVVLPSLVRILN
jgi:hypothetical protein